MQTNSVFVLFLRKHIRNISIRSIPEIITCSIEGLEIEIIGMNAVIDKKLTLKSFHQENYQDTNYFVIFTRFFILLYYTDA